MDKSNMKEYCSGSVLGFYDDRYYDDRVCILSMMLDFPSDHVRIATKATLIMLVAEYELLIF